MDENDWALTEKPAPVTPKITFETVDVTDPWYRGKEWEKYHQQGVQGALHMPFGLVCAEGHRTDGRIVPEKAVASVGDIERWTPGS